MGFFSSPKPAVPERDPELDRQLAEQQAENERLKKEEEDRKKREKDARLRGLRGSSALFANRFEGFGAEGELGAADQQQTDTLGTG